MKLKPTVKTGDWLSRSSRAVMSIAQPSEIHWRQRVPAPLGLTTSSTPVHAMKASDRCRAFGAIVGKALAGLDSGLGFIRILVSPR
jgi:hypothetical protein